MDQWFPGLSSVLVPSIGAPLGRRSGDRGQVVQKVMSYKVGDQKVTIRRGYYGRSLPMDDQIILL